MSATTTRLLDHDPDSGITEYYHFDPHTHGFTIETVQDVTGILETNQRLWNDAPLRFGEWSHCARVPMVMFQELAKQGITTAAGAILDEDRFRRWLNDRDNRAFRTRPGVL